MCSSDLLALASRAEDPDTLFFQRRLALEGDTAIGLRVKNLLDALDFDLDAHCTAVLGRHAGPRAASLARALAACTRALRATQPVRNGYPGRPS